MPFTVTDNPAESRYELYDGDTLAGVAAYRVHGDTVTFTHTEVADAYEGQGAGSQLAREALDDSRARGPPRHRPLPVHLRVDRAPSGLRRPAGLTAGRVRANQSRPRTGSTRGTNP